MWHIYSTQDDVVEIHGNDLTELISTVLTRKDVEDWMYYITPVKDSFIKFIKIPEYGTVSVAKIVVALFDYDGKYKDIRYKAAKTLADWVMEYLDNAKEGEDKKAYICYQKFFVTKEET